MQRVLSHLRVQVDIASLVAFRALFGAVLTLAAVRFVAKGWVHDQLIAPSYHFSYPQLEFVRPLPGALMHLHFALLVLAGLALTVGLRTRVAGGGDGFTVFTQGTNNVGGAVDLDALIAYIEGLSQPFVQMDQ